MHKKGFGRKWEFDIKSQFNQMPWAMVCQKQEDLFEEDSI